ncbi:YrzQ family protein [Heyndrickxia coagulans]|nr:YrzQ family protein [Heyndrickxia coagulans]
MNKMMMTAIGFGAGIAATQMAKNGFADRRQMRKMAKRVRKAFR